MTDTILLVCATEFERSFLPSAVSGRVLVTGVGPVETTLALCDLLARTPRPGLVLDFGVAGAYPGGGAGLLDLCIARCESFGDLGITGYAVVGYGDDDIPALLVCGEGDGAALWFAELFALLRRLHAVVHRVPYEVHERVAYLLNDRLVELCLLALDDEFYLLSALPGKVPHHPGKLVEDLCYGLHPHLHDRELEVRRYEVE